MSDYKDPIMEQIINGMEISAAFNADDGNPPYAYKHPNGKVNWFCGYDENEKLTSVFIYKEDKEEERQCDYMADETRAREVRDVLVQEGWTPIDPPKITVSYGKREAVEKPLKARQVKRFLDKKSKKY
jgi:hypothetical protein